MADAWNAAPAVEVGDGSDDVLDDNSGVEDRMEGVANRWLLIYWKGVDGDVKASSDKEAFLLP